MASTGFIAPDVVSGTTTSWLPLTTAYPSVAGCSDAFFLFPGQPAPFGFDPGYGYFAGGTLRCLPPAETSWHELDHQAPDGFTSLSIQPIECPEMFTTAVTEVRDVSSTYVMCCPSEYTVVNGQPGRVQGGCMSPLSSGQIITYTAQVDNGSWVDETSTFTTATSINAVVLLGWNVDHAAASTGSSMSSAASSMPTTTPISAAEEDTGLSTGAKAGIGVGIGVVVLAAILAIFLLFRRRSKKRRSRDEVVQYEDIRHSGQTEMVPQEKPNIAVHEMHPGGSKYDMQPPVELSDNQAVLVTAPQRKR